MRQGKVLDMHRTWKALSAARMEVIRAAIEWHHARADEEVDLACDRLHEAVAQYEHMATGGGGRLS